MNQIQSKITLQETKLKCKMWITHANHDNYKSCMGKCYLFLCCKVIVRMVRSQCLLKMKILKLAPSSQDDFARRRALSLCSVILSSMLCTIADCRCTRPSAQWNSPFTSSALRAFSLATLRASLASSIAIMCAVRFLAASFSNGVNVSNSSFNSTTKFFPLIVSLSLACCISIALVLARASAGLHQLVGRREERLSDPESEPEMLPPDLVPCGNPQHLLFASTSLKLKQSTVTNSISSQISSTLPNNKIMHKKKLCPKSRYQTYSTIRESHVWAQFCKTSMT